MRPRVALHSLRLIYRAQVQELHGPNLITDRQRERMPAACSKSQTSSCSSQESHWHCSQRSSKGSQAVSSSHTRTGSSSHASSRDSKSAATPAAATTTTCQPSSTAATRSSRTTTRAAVTAACTHVFSKIKFYATLNHNLMSMLNLSGLKNIFSIISCIL